MAADGDALLAGTIANPRLWRLGMLLDMEAALFKNQTTWAFCSGDFRAK